MSALVGVAACLCALSVFVATGLDRADALKLAEACRCEAVLVVAAARSMVDTLATRLKGTLRSMRRSRSFVPTVGRYWLFVSNEPAWRGRWA